MPSARRCTPRFAAAPTIAAAPRSPDRPARSADDYTVQPGDTLSAIAARLSTSRPRLYALDRDRIADPD